MEKSKIIDYNRILKECFGDYSMNRADIDKLSISQIKQEKQFLFQKILSNSTDILKDLKIFSLDDLKELLNDYKIPKFNNEFLQKRKDIVEYIFFDKPVNIEELKWSI